MSSATDITEQGNINGSQKRIRFAFEDEENTLPLWNDRQNPQAETRMEIQNQVPESHIALYEQALSHHPAIQDPGRDQAILFWYTCFALIAVWVDSDHTNIPQTNIWQSLFWLALIIIPTLLSSLQLAQLIDNPKRDPHRFLLCGLNFFVASFFRTGEGV